MEAFQVGTGGLQLGLTDLQLVVRHVLPQIAPLLIANTVLTVAVAIFDETALAFLGLGDLSRISLGKIIEKLANAGITSRWTCPPGATTDASPLRRTQTNSCSLVALSPLKFGSSVIKTSTATSSLGLAGAIVASAPRNVT